MERVEPCSRRSANGFIRPPRTLHFSIHPRIDQIDAEPCRRDDLTARHRAEVAADRRPQCLHGTATALHPPRFITRGATGARECERQNKREDLESTTRSVGSQATRHGRWGKHGQAHDSMLAKDETRSFPASSIGDRRGLKEVLRDYGSYIGKDRGSQCADSSNSIAEVPTMTRKPASSATESLRRSWEWN